MPACWRGLEITVEVEAKAKELAVARLMKDLAGEKGALHRRPPEDHPL